MSFTEPHDFEITVWYQKFKGFSASACFSENSFILLYVTIRIAEISINDTQR